MQRTPLYVPIESLSEYSVSEISYTGQECLEKPLNPSEKFQKIVNRINFDEVLQNNLDGSKQSKDAEEDKTSHTDTPKLNKWPFEKIKTSVRASLNEICAMTDLLTVVKEKRYMVLENLYADQSEQKSAFTLAGKKAALSNASDILLKGHEHLHLRSSEMAESRSLHKASYHSDLIKLRQRYRLKLFGSTVFGDLSLKSAGSTFPQIATFEVRENLGLLESSVDALDPPTLTSKPPGELELKCTQVVLGGEEEGICALRVVFESRTFSGETVNLSEEAVVVPSSRITKEADLGRSVVRMERAPGSLVAREIFTRLCQEASLYRDQMDSLLLGVVVANDTIRATIFPGVHVALHLDRRFDPKSCLSVSHSTLVLPPQPDDTLVCPSGGSLEVALKLLLSRSFNAHKTASSLAQPVTMATQTDPVRRGAGPQETSREVLQRSRQQTLQAKMGLLREFLEICKHHYLRRQVHETLLGLARTSTDPCMILHWGVVNSPTRTSVSVDLMTPGYELYRTRIAISIGTHSLETYMADGTSLHFGFDMRELRSFVRYQCVHYYINTLQRLAISTLDCKCVSTSIHNGYGTTDQSDTNPTVLLLSVVGYSRLVCVRGSAESGIRVFVRRDVPGSVGIGELGDACVAVEWKPDIWAFREVDLDRMAARSILGKVENLLACLKKLP